jgi:transcription elongation factor GreA
MMSDQAIPITKKDYQALTDELDKLKEESKKLSTEIARARDLGDLSENAEYHAAREQKSMVDAKISNLKSKIATFQIVDEMTLTGETVEFGCTVKLYDMKFKEEIECKIVGAGQGNTMNEISVSSPVGKALLGKKVGDITEVTLPTGPIKYKILSISV